MDWEFCEQIYIQEETLHRARRAKANAEHAAQTEGRKARAPMSALGAKRSGAGSLWFSYQMLAK